MTRIRVTLRERLASSEREREKRVTQLVEEALILVTTIHCGFT